MGKRRHVDLSNEEPSQRADPRMEQIHLTIGWHGVELRGRTHRGSAAGAAAAITLILTALLMFTAGAAALARWLGMTATGTVFAAATALLTALTVSAPAVVRITHDTHTPHRHN